MYVYILLYQYVETVSNSCLNYHSYIYYIFTLFHIYNKTSKIRKKACKLQIVCI